MVFDSYYKAKLLSYLYIKTNLTMNSRQDLRNLSALMLNKLKTNLSPSTLYRIFQSKNNTHVPTMTTLNLLAQFCGFQDWNMFRDSVDNERWMNQSIGEFSTHSKGKSLLYLNLEKGNWDILEELFQGLQAGVELNFFEKYQLSNTLLYALRGNPNQCKEFFERFSGFPIIRAAFFEIVSETGFEVPHFDFGLNCYLKQMTHLDEITQLRDITYAKCLLFKQFFVAGNQAGWEKLGEEIVNTTQIDENAVPDTFHIFPYSRFLGCRYLYLTTRALSKEQRAEHEDQLFTIIENIFDRLNPEQKQALFFFVAESISLSKPNAKTVDRLKSTFGNMIDLLPNFPKSNNIHTLVKYMDMNIANVLIRPQLVKS